MVSGVALIGLLLVDQLQNGDLGLMADRGLGGGFPGASGGRRPSFLADLKLSFGRVVDGYNKQADQVAPTSLAAE